jgi:acetylornithine deacetylase/succinyl-diaminopimelate desuccinylase-like protein
LHSGIFGGAVHNPLQALCAIIARLHNAHGRVAMPGFYDRVRHWSAQERAYMARVGPTDAQILRDAQVGHGWGECGYTLYERTTIRPALTVNGIVGGYQGPGNKSIILGHETQLSACPQSGPVQIERLFRQYMARLAPPHRRPHHTHHLAAKPVLVDRHHPAMRAAVIAYASSAPPVFLRQAAHPVVSTLQKFSVSPQS